MKIFYAIQGTGNGHISRAVQLYPYLKKYGEVDFFLSGSNAQLNVDIPIKFKSKGVCVTTLLSLFLASFIESEFTICVKLCLT